MRRDDGWTFQLNERGLYLEWASVMSQISIRARYTAAMAECGGRRLIEASVLGRLADHECRHGRLHYDRTPPCACWPSAGAPVVALSRPVGRLLRGAADGALETALGVRLRALERQDG